MMRAICSSSIRSVCASAVSSASYLPLCGVGIINKATSSISHAVGNTTTTAIPATIITSNQQQQHRMESLRSLHYGHSAGACYRSTTRAVASSIISAARLSSIQSHHRSISTAGAENLVSLARTQYQRHPNRGNKGVLDFMTDMAVSVSEWNTNTAARDKFWDEWRERARTDPAAAWALARWWLPNSNANAQLRADVEHWLHQASVGGIWQAAATCARRWATGSYPFEANGRNPTAATTYWQLAVVTNDPQALYRYADALLRGDGIPKNVALAAAYFFNAAVQRYVDAMLQLYQLQIDPTVTIQLPDANDLSRGARAVPSVQSSLTLPAVTNLSDADRQKRALGWAKAAAEAGDGEGAYIWGVALMEGRYVTQDLEAAKRSFEVALAQKQIFADWSLNVLLPLYQTDLTYNWTGVPASVQTAIDKERKNADLMGYYEMRNVANVYQLLVKHYLHCAMLASQMANNSEVDDKTRTAALQHHQHWMKQTQRANELHVHYVQLQRQPFRRTVGGVTSSVSSTSTAPPVLPLPGPLIMRPRVSDSSSALPTAVSPTMSDTTPAEASSSSPSSKVKPLPELSPEKSLQLGRQLLNNPANYEDAVRYLDRAATHGILEAQYLLTTQYKAGSNCARASDIVRWAQMALSNQDEQQVAATQYDRPTMTIELHYLLGAIYMGGEAGVGQSNNDVESDLVKAEYHLREAMRLGDISRSGHWLAHLLWNDGNSIIKAKKEAVVVFQNSSDAGGDERIDLMTGEHDTARHHHARICAARSALMLAQQIATTTEQKLQHYERALRLFESLPLRQLPNHDQLIKLRAQIAALQSKS